MSLTTISPTTEMKIFQLDAEHVSRNRFWAQKKIFHEPENFSTYIMSRK